MLEKAFSNGCLVGGAVPLQRVVIRVSLLFLLRLPIAEGGQVGVVGLWSGTTLAGWGMYFRRFKLHDGHFRFFSSQVLPLFTRTV